jgi:hypothetical protein
MFCLFLLYPAILFMHPLTSFLMTPMHVLYSHVLLHPILEDHPASEEGKYDEVVLFSARGPWETERARGGEN